MLPALAPTPTPTAAPSPRGEHQQQQQRRDVVTVTSTAGSGGASSTAGSGSSGTTVPIGPVVGGVVAGVVIVLLIGGTWWYCHAKAEREREERRERRRRKRALAAAGKNGSRPALSTATSAASLVSMNKAGARTNGGGSSGSKGGEDEKNVPPVPPLPSAYALPANNGYPQQGQGQPPQHGRQRSQGQAFQAEPYYPSAAGSHDPYAQPPQDAYARGGSQGTSQQGYNDPPQSFFNAYADQNQSQRSGDARDGEQPGQATSSTRESGGAAAPVASPSKSKRKSRFRQPEPVAQDADATRRYQPSRPSPLAAAAPIVRAEERKPEDVPKWGSKPFKRASEDGPLSPTSASRLQAIDQQQQQQQRHGNNDYAPAETLRSTGPAAQNEPQSQRDSRITSGQWGVAYTADEPVQQQQHRTSHQYSAYDADSGRQIAEDPYASQPPTAKGPSPTGQRKVTPGYPHFTLNDGDDQDEDDMTRVRNQSAAAMRHRSTGEQSEDSFQYDSPYFYPSLASQGQGGDGSNAEVLSDPPTQQFAGRQAVQRDVYSYGSPRRSAGGR